MTRYYWIVIISAVVYFSNLGGTSIYILDEAKNAGCALEMKEAKQWIIPTFNGKLRTDKPPLHYYFMITSYSILGVSPFAARFFSAFAGVLLSILVYRNIRLIINEHVAFYTSLVMLSSIQLTIQFHLAVPDPYLILCFAWCFFSFYRGFHIDSGQMKWFYVACALGFLSKGLIAVVMPGLIITLYLIVTKQVSWAAVKKLKLPVGAVIFSVLALPWYLAVGYLTDGEWLRGFFIQHNLDRYTSTMEGHRAFPLAPFVILIAALLPFSVFIAQSVSMAWKARNNEPFLIFSLVIAFAFAAFFSLSKTILPSYPAPAIPFLSIVIGYWLFRLHDDTTARTGTRISLTVNIVISAALVIGAYLALKQEKEMNDLIPLTWIFAAVPVGSVLGAYFFIRKMHARFIYCWSGSWIILGLLFFYIAYPKIDAKNPVSASIPMILHDYPDRKVVAYQIFNPAYVFGLQQTIEVMNTVDELKARCNSGEKIVVVTREKYREQFQQIETLKQVYSGKDLFERNHTIVLAN